MIITRAAIAALGLAFVATALAGASAQAAPTPVRYAATITIDFNMDALEPLATPDEVTVAPGDVVKVINKLSEGPSEGVYIALVNGSGVARIGATSCTTATACKLDDNFQKNPSANVTAVAEGTVKILRYNSNLGSRPTYLGRIVIQQSKTITISGERTSVFGKPAIRIVGATLGFRAGAGVIPFIKLPGQSSYTAGLVTATVRNDGSFIWERTNNQKTYIYFQSINGDTKSERITIETR
ncbi:MAG: hypothetical protein NT180_02110 [Actinobacteria bacterium]|nr:hypothetical protein [Actinomycetota bacterium]